MALKWSTVRAEHVLRACQLVVSGVHPARAKSTGLFLLYEGYRLPAKHVLRLAYLLANGLELETTLRFSSGESLMLRLRRLGFNVVREESSSKTPSD